MKKFIYSLLLFFSSLNEISAQDLLLNCVGKTEMSSIIGLSKYDDSFSYEFKNGKLYGHIETDWSENSIFVKIKKQPGENFEFYERTIIIDRLLGSVTDLIKAWRSDLRKIGDEPNVIYGFKGNCKKESKRF